MVIQEMLSFENQKPFEENNHIRDGRFHPQTRYTMVVVSL